MFLLIANRKESVRYGHRKGRKKIPAIISFNYFLSLFSREKTKLLFVNHYTFYIKIKIYKRGDFPFLYIF